MASYRWFLAGIAAPIALAAAIQVSSAAQIGYPLPEDSLEVNGVHQTKTSHVVVHVPYIAPLPETGLHPHAARGLLRRYSGTPIDVLRYHNDNYPTGWNQAETDLTPTTVHSASFGLLQTLNVDGNVHAQPLIVSNFEMPDGQFHNVLIIVTGHDTVYAFDAQDYTQLWKRSLGTPQPTNDVGCGDITPEYGIGSTPVIVRPDANTATIYLISATEPAPNSFHTKIHALNVLNGRDIMKAREINPRAGLGHGEQLHFDPQNQWNRASLAYANGSIYVGIGSHCDNVPGSISGWLLRYDASTLALQNSFNTIEHQAKSGYDLSSIWMSGFSPAISPDGSKIYAVTGNGDFDLTTKRTNYGESVLGLSSDLNKTTVDYFTPHGYAGLNSGDADFGSGGAMLIPTVSGQTAPPMLVAMGKASIAYLLNADSLGGLEQTEGDGGLQQVGISACWCGPAYYVGPSGGVVFYQGYGDVLKSYAVATGATPSLTLTHQGTTGAGFGGSFPVVSSNGTTAHTGVVWVLRRNTTMQLEAYDAEALGAPIFAANSGHWSNSRGDFSSPLVADGRVYSPAYKTVAVFGLTD